MSVTCWPRCRVWQDPATGREADQVERHVDTAGEVAFRIDVGVSPGFKLRDALGRRGAHRLHGAIEVGPGVPQKPFEPADVKNILAILGKAASAFGVNVAMARTASALWRCLDAANVGPACRRCPATPRSATTTLAGDRISARAATAGIPVMSVAFLVVARHCCGLARADDPQAASSRSSRTSSGDTTATVTCPGDR